MPGPPPTPTNILKARGSWRGNARPKEPQPSDKLPAAPKWLDKAAKQVYRQVVAQLESMNVGRSPDVNAICRYCRKFVRWKQADLSIQKYGEVQPMKDKFGKVVCMALGVFVKLEKSLAADLDRLDAKFGFTPADRTRIQVEVSIPAKCEGKARFFKAG